MKTKQRTKALQKMGQFLTFTRQTSDKIKVDPENGIMMSNRFEKKVNW